MQMRSRQAWTVVAAAAIAVLGVAGSPGAFASPSGGAAKCVRQVVAGKQACLRAGQACRPANRSDFLLAGFECVRRRGKRVLARASLAAQRGPHAFLYDSRGLPTPPD